MPRFRFLVLQSELHQFPIEMVVQSPPLILMKSLERTETLAVQMLVKKDWIVPSEWTGGDLELACLCFDELCRKHPYASFRVVLGSSVILARQTSLHISTGCAVWRRLTSRVFNVAWGKS
jgi:hypothetical protein